MPLNSTDSPLAGSPGYAFKDEKLCIFREHEVMVIHGWPNPRAVRKARGSDEWAAFDPAFTLVKPYRSRRQSKPAEGEAGQLSLELDFQAGRRPISPTASVEEQRRRAFERFRFSLPGPVAAALEQFRIGQWGLLVMMSRHEEALDLVRSNPVLAYLVVTHARDRRLGHGQMRDLLRKKQKEILGELRLPQSPAAVKILRKVYVKALTPEHTNHLRQALRSEPTRKALTHVSRLHSGVMDLVGKPGLFVLCTPKVLLEVSDRKEELYRPLTANRVADILAMRRHMEEGSVIGSQFSSIRQIEEFHRKTLVDFHRHGEEDRIRQEQQRREQRAREERRRRREVRAQQRREQALREQQELQDRRQRARQIGERENRAPARRARSQVEIAPRFAKPPIPGNTYISPITTHAELVREGRLQNNCVGTYGKQVASGQVYIYRVTWPERATLSINRGPDGNWRRSQLEKAGNHRAGPRTLQAVDEWLAAYRVGA